MTACTVWCVTMALALAMVEGVAVSESVAVTESVATTESDEVTESDTIEYTWSTCLRTDTRQVTQIGSEDPNITDLWLTDCNINSLSSDQLRLPNLNLIYLDRNNFKGQDIPANLFLNCPRLERVSFSGNNMIGAPEELLQGLELKSLWLDNCSLQEVPKLVRKSSLLFLYLSKNEITLLHDANTFSSLENLLWLKLSHNLIKSINENIFQPLINIEEIYLNNNKIKFLDEKLFQNLTNLEKLFLQNNEINYIHPTMFYGSSSLIELNLANNKFTHLPPGFLSGVNSLEKFFFYKNPWQCGCLNEILDEIQGNSKSLTYIKVVKGKERKPTCGKMDNSNTCNRERQGDGSAMEALNAKA